MVSICFVENMPKVSAAEFCRNNKEKCKYVETTQNPSHFLQQAHLLFLQQAHIITHLTLCCSWFSLNIVLGGMARHLLTLFSFVQRTCIPEIICFVQTFVCKPALLQEQLFLTGPTLNSDICPAKVSFTPAAGRVHSECGTAWFTLSLLC